MELYLAVRGSQEVQPRLFPLIVGRTWLAGRYTHLGGPLVEGHYLRTQGPLLDKDEYIPLEPDLGIARYQFEVGWDEGGPWVRDLHDPTGTILNGVRLVPNQKYPLRLDDQLQVGRCVVVVAGDAHIGEGKGSGTIS
jgi:hypothetical protein